jgi:hypothetical protein
MGTEEAVDWLGELAERYGVPDYQIIGSSDVMLLVFIGFTFIMLILKYSNRTDIISGLLFAVFGGLLATVTLIIGELNILVFILSMVIAAISLIIGSLKMINYLKYKTKGIINNG